jgi:hypothetical protein
VPFISLLKLTEVLPPEITDFQVVSGVGRDAVILTPEKLRTFVLDHCHKGYIIIKASCVR